MGGSIVLLVVVGEVRNCVFFLRYIVLNGFCVKGWILIFGIWLMVLVRLVSILFL